MALRCRDLRPPPTSRYKNHVAVFSRPHETRKNMSTTWTKPAFEEIKMDAEAKSYSAEL